ncbi:MAG: hypothetical protein IT559_05935 [Alphaproteobacteria bacterium]|nr:hypothetical protein [Alphaproteobacteria bacterium]
MPNGIRKNIAPILLALIVLAQFALAQHSTVHFSEKDHAGFHLAHSVDHEDHGSDQNKSPYTNKLCQICLFAKSFSHALLSNPALISHDTFKVIFVFPSTQDVRVQAIASAYQPRAPPIFLI